MNKILKISDNFKISVSVILIFIALYFSLSSGSAGAFSFLIILLSGIILAVGFAFWNIREFKSLFIENLKLTFGISSFVYILGYIFYALEPILM